MLRPSATDFVDSGHMSGRAVSLRPHRLQVALKSSGLDDLGLVKACSRTDFRVLSLAEVHLEFDAGDPARVGVHIGVSMAVKVTVFFCTEA